MITEEHPPYRGGLVFDPRIEPFVQDMDTGKRWPLATHDPLRDPHHTLARGAAE